MVCLDSGSILDLVAPRREQDSLPSGDRMVIDLHSSCQVADMAMAQQVVEIEEAQAVQFCLNYSDHRLALLDQENGRAGSLTYWIWVEYCVTLKL